MRDSDAAQGSSVDVVRAAYAALDAEDVPAFLTFFAAEAVIRYPSGGALPYGGSWNGHAKIGEFLDLHDQTEEIVLFEVRTVEATGERVFAT